MRESAVNTGVPRSPFDKLRVSGIPFPLMVSLSNQERA